MTAPKRKKDKVQDKRRNNGRPSQGLTEARQLITGPAGLMQAVRAQAAYMGVSVSEAWRMAARKYYCLVEPKTGA